MSPLVYFCVVVFCVMIAYFAGRKDGWEKGYWSAIGRPIPVRELWRIGGAYGAVGTPVQGCSVMEDKTEQHGAVPPLFVAGDSDSEAPKTVDARTPWNARTGADRRRVEFTV